MAEAFDHLTNDMVAFIAHQHVFFVATAPSSGGRVNVSPKGYDTFRVLGPDRVAYIDLTGSGVETIAHVRENERITFMFCAFEGDPVIVRIHGRGHPVVAGDSEFEELLGLFPTLPGVRSIVVVDVERTSTSCGWAVPLMDYVGERAKLADEFGRRGEDWLEEYRRKHNTESVDGLIALAPSLEAS